MGVEVVFWVRLVDRSSVGGMVVALFQGASLVFRKVLLFVVRHGGIPQQQGEDCKWREEGGWERVLRAQEEGTYKKTEAGRYDAPFLALWELGFWQQQRSIQHAMKWAGLPIVALGPCDRLAST
jgi:hypothetical protein